MKFEASFLWQVLSKALLLTKLKSVKQLKNLFLIDKSFIEPFAV